MIYLMTFLFVFGLEISLLELGIMIGVAIISVLLSAGIIGKKLAPIAREFNEAASMYRKAKSADSPGGEQLTDEEKRQLREEALDVFVTTWEQYGDSILSWITKRIAGLFSNKKTPE